MPYRGRPFQKGNIPWNKGKKLSKERRRKISESQKGRKSHPLSKECKRKLSEAHKGKKHSEETKRKMSESHKGERGGNWKGGITSINHIIRSSFEYRLWRTAVFKRDNYTCVWCKKRGVRLNADHIKPFAYYPALRFAIDNGRTLCVPCHRKTDTFGKKTIINGRA